ncbi:uncharacterized protein LOC116853424 [Odontomachus brunneus]|uniref:uncharacterized protein LOC116853424 n=1 Tax=Odontomachus brunneus TaxID=486640 RepID=UPI0013F2726E|nr:uncharacterized protein LOC116853424 [Odontomachus brunneus]
MMIVSSYSSKILAVNALHGGSTHDSRVFRSSSLFNHLQKQQEADERGDAAYPLKPFLLKPFMNAPAGSPEAKYTEHIVKARSAVEKYWDFKRTMAMFEKRKSIALSARICSVYY